MWIVFCDDAACSTATTKTTQLEWIGNAPSRASIDIAVTADVLSTLVVASLPLADLFAEVTVPHVLVVAFLGPTIGVFFDGAVFGALWTTAYVLGLKIEREQAARA